MKVRNRIRLIGYSAHFLLISKEKMNRLQNLLEPTKNILWLLPFIAFAIGYFFLQFFIADNSVQVPALLGKNLLQATQICSEFKLNLRIIAEKEVADLQPGTIVKQKPSPNKSIKPHQSIFIVVTKLPAPVIAPDFIKKNSANIEKICKEKGIKNKTYVIETAYPKGECFGQIPSNGQILELKKMSCYISAGNPQQYLFPDLTDLPLVDVISFLKQYEISCDVYDKDQKIHVPYQHNLVVINQKPLAGTFVQLNNKLYVQLQVAQRASSL